MQQPSGRTSSIRFHHAGQSTELLGHWSFERPIAQRGLLPLIARPDLVDRTTPYKQSKDGSVNNLWLSDPLVARFDHLKPLCVQRFAEVLKRLTRSFENGTNALVAIFLIPLETGFVTHSEFMVHRLAGCEFVSHSQSFLSPREEVCAYQRCEGDFEHTDLLQALKKAIGAILLPMDVLETDPAYVMEQLDRRLALQWLMAEQPSEKWIDVTAGPENLKLTRQRWESIAALGIKVVVFGPEHWWKDGGDACHLREAFVPLELSNDDGLCQRIVEAVQRCGYKLDGLFAPFNDHIHAVAVASKVLGLFGSDPEAIALSMNKCLTNELINPDSSDIFAVNSVSELDDRVNKINFPVVCKPSIGRSSEGVRKARNTLELRRALNDIFAFNSNTHGALIEPYINGPEVDINLILLNGRVLFAEVVDDFPKSADLSESEESLFVETQDVRPSRLPKDEQEKLVKAMRIIVQKLGFNTGIFHCEARVKNSKMRYVLRNGASIPELEPAIPQLEQRDESVFLHEVNPRMPGIMSSFGALFAKGIDYWALSILCALQDWRRFEALSKPFDLDEMGSGCGHVVNLSVYSHVDAELVRARRPGLADERLHSTIMEDPSDQLRERNPNIAKYVLRHNAVALAASRYGHDSNSGFIWAATVVIRSPSSRQHALRVAEEYTVLYQDFVSDKNKSSCDREPLRRKRNVPR